MGTTIQIKFEDIELRDNLRKDLGDIDGLVNSIRAVGLRNPLLVQYKHSTGIRPDGKRVNSRYYLLDGYRRYEALRRLHEEDPKNFSDVWVSLEKCNDEEAAVIMVAANVARKDWNAMEVADGIAHLLNLGRKLPDISKSLGLSLGWCQQLIRMRQGLSAPVQDAVKKGSLPISVAKTLVDLDEAKQNKTLAAYSETKATKGKKEAKRQANREAERPERPGMKEIHKTLEDCSVAGADDNYWRGASNALRWIEGLQPKFAELAATEAAKIRKDKGDGESRQATLAGTEG